MNEEGQTTFDIVDVLMFIGLALPAFLLSFYLMIAILKIINVQGIGLRALVAQAVAYGCTLIPLYAIFRARYSESPMRMLRMSVTLREASSSISLGIMTALLTSALAWVLKTPRMKTPMEDVLSDTPSLIAATILGITLGPWFEELIFRGLLQPLIARWAGIITGIIAAALPFALLHGPQYAWSWRHVLLITLVGAAFGLRRHLTNSTGAAVVMHAAYNAVLFAALIASRITGAETPQTI